MSLAKTNAFRVQKLFLGLIVVTMFLMVLFPVELFSQIPKTHQISNDGFPRIARIQGIGEDPFNQINTIMVENGQVISRSQTEMPKEAFSIRKTKIGQRFAAASALQSPEDKIHPALRKQVNASTTGTQKIIINFREDMKIPRFPDLFKGELRESPRNQEAIARIQQMVENIKGQRANEYARLTQELLSAHQAKVLATYWLIKAVLVEMPLASVLNVASRD